jgi:hypothetical protein
MTYVGLLERWERRTCSDPFDDLIVPPQGFWRSMTCFWAFGL